MSLQFHETQAVSRSIRPVTVVQVAAAVFVLQLAWERLVRASAAERRRLLTVIVAGDGGDELDEELWMNGDRRYELVGQLLHAWRLRRGDRHLGVWAGRSGARGRDVGDAGGIGDVPTT